MKIQWFPGHMHKASKEVQEKLPEMDMLIEVLDARIPFSSENPMISSLRGDKPCLKIFNKSDLADPKLTQQWQDYFEQGDGINKGIKTLTISRDEVDKIKQISTICRKMITRSDKRVKEIHAMIVGIPNVGKSTIINTLTGRTIAKTGNEAAVTRQQQRIKIAEDIVLFDTPGMLWGNIENENSGYRLAATGAIKDTAFDNDDVAFFVAEYLIQNYPERLVERYQLDHTPQSEIELIESIGRLRGCLRKGGQVELDKACKILINEYRLGMLGAITLETPEMTVKEMEKVVFEREKKITESKANKAERKKRWRKNRK